MIAIYNLEPKYFNLALEKIRKYYEDQGGKVDDYKPLWHNKYDKIYCSSIFTWTDKSMVTSDMICGGTGFDLTTKLSAEIEMVRVKKNVGFTTRGCPRKCPFCVVPQKEGYIVYVVGDIYDLWDGRSKTITLYDSNILALPKHFRKICQQILREDLKVDFNQGLDIRYITHRTARLLKKLHGVGYYPHWRFSWDLMKLEKVFLRKIKLLLNYLNPRSIMVYVFVNYNTSLDEDMHRVKTIQGLGCDPFVMVYDKPNASRLIKEFARWNNRFCLKGLPFKKYLQIRGVTNVTK